MTVFCARRRGWAGHAGIPPRAVFPVVVDRPAMLGIMAGMHQKDRYALFSGSGMCKARVAGILTSRCVPPVVLKPMMPRIMAGMIQRDSYVATFWRTCLLYITTGARGSDCSKTVDFPQLQSIQFVDISFVTQWHIPCSLGP